MGTNARGRPSDFAGSAGCRLVQTSGAANPFVAITRVAKQAAQPQFWRLVRHRRADVRLARDPCGAGRCASVIANLSIACWPAASQ